MANINKHDAAYDGDTMATKKNSLICTAMTPVYGILILDTFSAILRRSHDWPVVTGGGNTSTRRKPPHNPKSVATFSLVPLGIRDTHVLT